MKRRESIEPQAPSSTDEDTPHKVRLEATPNKERQNSEKFTRYVCSTQKPAKTFQLGQQP
jgi:hypothetical protein